MPRLLPGGATDRRVKLNHDITLCFDRLAINQCRLIAPFVNSIDDGRNELRRTKERPYALNAPILADSSFDAN